MKNISYATQFCVLLGALFFMPVGAATNDDLAPTQLSVPTVLITGANRGLGLHFARQFAESGWHVIATTRRPAQADELQQLARQHPKLVIEELDIRNDENIATLKARYETRPIDVLLNNAARLGEISRQNFGSIDFGLMDEILETNVIGTLKVTEAFADNVRLSEQKKIVTLGSSAGTHAKGHDANNFYGYRPSKAALHFIMQHLAIGLKPEGITVIMLEPGFADSRGIMTMKPEDAPDQETRELAELVQRFGATMRDPAESVRGMITVINKATLNDSGRFFLFDGSELQP